MIENRDFYFCTKCKESYSFLSSSSYSTKCPVCGEEMRFSFNANCSTDKSILDRLPPKIECPYCHSTNTSKISGAGRIVSAGLFGLGSKKVGKQWHCNRCNSDF